MILIPHKTIEIAEGYEGLGGFNPVDNRYYPYHCSADAAGVMTIGRGHVISAADLKSGRFAKGLSLAEVDELIAADWQPRAERLMKIMKDPTEDEFAGSLSLFYNLEEAFAPGHSARIAWDAYRKGRTEKLKAEFAATFLLYHNSAKKPRLGLWRRRASEALCVLTGKVLLGNKDAAQEQLLYNTLKPLITFPPKPKKFY